MAARNPDSVTNAQGEFHPSIPRDEPSTTHGSATTPPPNSPPKPSPPAPPPQTAPSNQTTSPKSPAKPTTKTSCALTAKNPLKRPLRRLWAERLRGTCIRDWGNPCKGRMSVIEVEGLRV
ncbi:MAG: hypothetical protein L6R42_002581 [Xanthoria sp. 1 TBL-2021]|nr:MAG: hypothetical protein L6R42_002581 [Xanthoria sp. 1 TBL-2021]